MVVGREDDENCEPLDIVAAAREVGMRLHVLRRYFDRPVVRALIRSERRAFREMLCGSNEAALKRVRDQSKNGMVTVAAVRALEQLDTDDSGRSVNAPSPGVIIKIVHQTVSPETVERIIDVTPSSAKPAPAIESGDPIFKPPGYWVRIEHRAWIVGKSWVLIWLPTHNQPKTHILSRFVAFGLAEGISAIWVTGAIILRAERSPAAFPESARAIVAAMLDRSAADYPKTRL
jgi:hypothetical protein